MSRFAPVLLCMMSMAGCSVDGSGRPVFLAQSNGPSMDQPGTCFLYVEEPQEGSFNLVSGIGDGTMRPMATRLTGMDAAALDAAWAKERRIMDINPECLAILASDRSKPRRMAK